MLSINLWDLLWTFVNFALLYLVLNKLLYKPLVRFMDQRDARIRTGLDAQAAAQEVIAAKEAQLQAEKDQCRREAKRLVDEAAAQAAAERQSQSEQLRQEAHHRREEMRRQVRDRQAQDAERLAAQEAELAALLAEQLLHGVGPGAGL